MNTPDQKSKNKKNSISKFEASPKADKSSKRIKKDQKTPPMTKLIKEVKQKRDTPKKVTASLKSNVF